jgi:hypothetical protein
MLSISVFSFKNEFYYTNSKCVEAERDTRMIVVIANIAKI